MLEKWEKALDNKEAFGALLTDLSKPFDCLNHKLGCKAACIRPISFICEINS